MSTARKARVFVVDDSIVIRKILTDILAADPAIDVAGTASNGKMALQKLPDLKPDLVTLDIEMPEMDGLETLRHIRRDYPRLPVLMFSSLTHAGASATLDALSLGASDYVTKPANVGSVTAGMNAIREQMIPRIYALCRLGVNTQVRLLAPLTRPAMSLTRPMSGVGTRPSAPAPASVTSSMSRSGGVTGGSAAHGCARRVDAVVIGSSTGGPNALATLWAGLSSTLAVPFFVVQHMPPMFTTLLAERLDKVGTVKTCEAVDDGAVTPGRCWLAPGDNHMLVERTRSGDRVRLNQAPPESSCRPAVDPLFRSAAQLYGPGVLAVVLTGMGSDGKLGAEAVRAAGGQVVVQDDATSVVWGMPGAVANAGLADAVLPLERIAAEINQRVAFGRPLAATR
jgi:two-component system, chemotaxis family, protein-glutamate methylesterase/glutaminase